MKNPLITLTSNEDEGQGQDCTWGQPVFVSVLEIQGITPGELLYASDKDEKARRTSGTGECAVGRGAKVWWADQHHCVRESVKQVEALVTAKLKELSTR